MYRGSLIFRDASPTYIHIPKTAGRSFTKAVCDNPANSKLNYSTHAPARLIIRHHEFFKESFKFAVVRNPYERYYSACKHARIYDARGIEELSELQLSSNMDWSSNLDVMHYEHFFTQTHFVTANDNKTLLIDYTARYENLPELVEKLKEHGIDVTRTFNIRENKSINWPELLTPKTKLNIAKLYKQDFELFNYDI